MPRLYNDTYAGERLNRVAFPLGGLGAGMFCLEGTGALSHFSLRHRPEVFNEPLIFGALWVKGVANGARVLEGPAPGWKIFSPHGAGNGLGGRAYGLPHMAGAAFRARFPFATVKLEHPRIPLAVELTGWSPFLPGDADNSSLPVGALEYRFENTGSQTVEAVFSFHAKNFMANGSKKDAVVATRGGFILWEPSTPEKANQAGAFAVTTDDAAAKVNCAWFRGAWFDPLTMLWKTIAAGAAEEKPAFTDGDPSPGGSIAVPFTLAPGAKKTVRVLLAWHVRNSEIRTGPDLPDEPPCACGEPGKKEMFRPWYAARFADVNAVLGYWREQYDVLRERSARFSDAFYDVSLPAEIVEAIAANLTILKSPTVLREHSGRLWAWEGCGDEKGCCHGSCTHVWNYAQALPHLFPDLERSLRQTEFHDSQDEHGHQNFRSSLPLRTTDHKFHAAADGQLGGIMKLHREWRINGDTAWLRSFWPKAKASLEYCIKTWDPGEEGLLREPHHNTYDIEFWGPDAMCCSFYLGALKAAALMGKALNEDVSRYQQLYEKGRRYVEEKLFNGEYFDQQIQWKGLRTPPPTEAQSMHTHYTPEARELLEREGPKYQYGTGCLSDGVLGAWLAAVCGVGEILDREKVRKHLLAVFKHNFRRDLSDHANPQRPGYAMNNEAGLLLCTWPRGGKLSLPFPYSDEVWTGFEYQVASHLLTLGQVDEALQIVRAARDRYDGTVRNPFNEYECGHWYARAMSSYGMLEGFTGVRYDAVTRTLMIEPRPCGDFRSFLATTTGFGNVGVKDGKPYVEVKAGKLDVQKIEYRR